MDHNRLLHNIKIRMCKHFMSYLHVKINRTTSFSAEKEQEKNVYKHL